MQPQNIIEKIWDAHVVTQNPGHPAILAVDFMLIHEVTSAQAFDTLRKRGLSVSQPERLLATLDHCVPTRPDREVIHDEAARNQVETLRRNAKEYGISLLDYGSGQGVVHVVGPEQGATQPGMTIVCGDSHTATHGAFGALAFGIGTSEVANVLATGCLLQHKPKTMLVEFEGLPGPGVFAKDLILKLIAEIGAGGATGHVIEYGGEAIRAMRMDERMTVCNMSIECGARAGLIAPDQTTYDYIRGRRFAPPEKEWDRAVSHWSSFASDPGCSYSQKLKINVSGLKPMVTWGINPGQTIAIDSCVPRLEDLPEHERQSASQALEYIGLKAGEPLAGTPIDWAFVGSCTNGRIEDLRAAAAVLKGRKVHPNVTFYVVPGSEAVMQQAIEEGLDRVFVEAGAHFRNPGCSLCLAMNDDKIPPGQRCISTSNRNFIGRQGTGSRTHLASPALVAASAISGKIASCQEYFS
ncbi:MAG: 3-isopropylmalate dehydratase large subunit [Deltaproteobacteria bacterium]|nr:3-isopropylmalate dehydratase large subunit [Deltaproteobacteria bacterium]